MRVDTTSLPFMAKLLNASRVTQVDAPDAPFPSIMILNVGTSEWEFFFDFSPAPEPDESFIQDRMEQWPDHKSKELSGINLTVWSGVDTFGPASVWMDETTIAHAIRDNIINW